MLLLPLQFIKNTIKVSFKLLARYWARLRCFYKEQPLTLIERYYGPTVAFYFAWIEFYTAMLVPAAFIGLLCFICGALYYATDAYTMVSETCNSEKYLCPVYIGGKYTTFEKIQKFCSMVKISFMIDNPITVMYSIFMTMWGAVFVIMWNRKQSQLIMRFNLHQSEFDNKYRLNYKKKAPVQRVSSITGTMEYHHPLRHIIFRKVVAYLVIMCTCGLVFWGVIVVMYFRLVFVYYGSVSDNKTFHDWYAYVEPYLSAFMTFMLIVMFDLFKPMLCYKLTLYENPRTQVMFDRKMSFKLILMSFANVFLPISYIAFFKGHFYYHPGQDVSQWKPVQLFKSDRCKINGCLTDLSAQIAFLMILKNLSRLAVEFTIPFIKVYINILRHRARNYPISYQWEEDFVLVPPDRDPVFIEYIKLVEQYGFMTLFLVALPIAPVLALINNLLEIRLDAIKILKNHRRYVSKKTLGIGAWLDIIKIITFLGTISNPLLISYSSSSISQLIYWVNNDFSMKGYFNSTLSEFLVDDYPGDEHHTRPDVKICYYLGKRYPPSHPQKYERTADFWYSFAMKSIFFILLENICLFATLILKRLIPKIPRKVELKRDLEAHALQEDNLRQSFKL